MKKIIVFITYCNTEEKQLLLLENIKYINSNYPDFHTLTFAHYPLKEEIQNLTTYYFYDPSNPVIKWPQKGIIYWVSIPDTNMKRCKAMNDYGFTTINQIVKGLQITSSFNYDFTYFINYDVELKGNFEKMKSLSESALRDNDIFTLFFYGQSNSKDPNSYDLRFLSCKTNICTKKLEGLLTMKSYLKSQYTTGESFLKNCIDYSDLKCCVHDQNLEFIAPSKFFENLTVLDDSLLLKNMNKSKTYFDKLFIGRKESSSINISFWDFKYQLKEIKIKINNENIMNFNFELNKKSSTFSIPDNTETIDILEIDGNIINEKIPISLDKEHLLNNYYENF